MSIFLERFHKETGNRFSYIKLSAVTVFVRKKTVQLTLIFPESVLTIGDADREAIQNGAIKALNSNAAVTVLLEKSFFDDEYAVAEALSFFRDYPLVSEALSANDIVCGQNENGKTVTVNLNPSAYRYCVERGILNELQKRFSVRYCDPVQVILCEKEYEPAPFSEDEPMPEMMLETAGGRYITVQNVDAFVGKPIYEKAVYIEDAGTHPRESLTVCGTISRLSSFSFVKKSGKSAGSEGVGWRLTIEDFTGAIDGVHFPSDKNRDKFGLLKQDKQVIVRGAYEVGRTEGTMSFKINDISYCSLPEKFILNRRIRPVDTQYRTVFPEVYTESEQIHLFDPFAGTRNCPTALHGKTIVVFDTETTGTNPLIDKIIEIGAVKIKDGKLTEVFSTLIDPQVPIPEGASKVNGITDDMVVGKPLIDAVLPDFYRFCDQAAIAAHNLPFDRDFVSAAGKSMGIYFEHEGFDTLTLARRYFPGQKAYNLGFLCEVFGIPLTNAHRASADAVATAKLLIKIFEKCDGLSLAQ